MREAAHAEEEMINMRAEKVSRVVLRGGGGRGGGEIKLIGNLTLWGPKLLDSSPSAGLGKDSGMPAPVTAGILLMTPSIPHKCHPMSAAVSNWKTAKRRARVTHRDVM